jgi:hypothetical protein
MAVATKDEELSLLAQESENIKRFRKKLRERCASIEEKITDDALDDTKEKIIEFISRNASEREPITSKISLFDSNQNAADISKKIQKIMQTLKQDQVTKH